MICLKLCKKFVFPQNFHSMQLDKISVLYAIHENVKLVVLIHKDGSRRYYTGIEHISVAISNIKIFDVHNSASNKVVFLKWLYEIKKYTKY